VELRDGLKPEKSGGAGDEKFEDVGRYHFLRFTLRRSEVARTAQARRPYQMETLPSCVRES
jgi:hypothetical protein